MIEFSLPGPVFALMFISIVIILWLCIIISLRKFIVKRINKKISKHYGTDD